MPPSAAFAPSGVRMSMSTLACPLPSSAEMVGSVVIPQSICLCCIAAMNVCPASTATEVMSVTDSPLWTARYLVRKLVEEPSPVTPSLRPFQSAGDLIWSATSLRHSSTSPGACCNWTTDSVCLPLPCRSMLWS